MAWDGFGTAVCSARMRPSATSAALDDEDTSLFRIVSLEEMAVSVLDALRLDDDDDVTRGPVLTLVSRLVIGNNESEQCSSCCR